MDTKRHRLYLIAPSGKKYKLGFLSPCRNGIVLGTTEVEGVDTSHLTIIAKDRIVSSHVTPQKHEEDRRYFPSMSKEEMVEKVKVLTEDLSEGRFISQLSKNQLSEEVLFITKKFVAWLNSIKETLYEKRVSSKEVTHILNFQRLQRKLPQLIEELKESPQSFFDLCKAGEILEDSSKFLGLSRSGLAVVPFENELVGVDFSFLAGFNFIPNLKEREISNPLAEIYQSIGVPQYMKEIEEKRFLEKLLSKDDYKGKEGITETKQAQKP
jgi:hypothetical protein